MEAFSNDSRLMFSLLDGLANQTRISNLIKQFQENENVQASSSVCFTQNHSLRITKRQNIIDFDKKNSELLHSTNRLLRISNVLYRVSFLKSKKDLLMDLDLALWPGVIPFHNLAVLDQYEYSVFQMPFSSHLNLFNETSLSFLSTRYAELMAEKNDRSAFREFVEISYGTWPNNGYSRVLQKLKQKVTLQDFVGIDFEGMLAQNF